MTPDSSQAPPKYIVDSIERIDTNVQELARKFDQFIAFDGPFVEARDLVHEHSGEIKTLRCDVDEARADTKTLIMKVSGWTAALVGGLFLAILRFFGGGN